MGPSGTSGSSVGGPSAHDAAFADMIEGLKNEAINRGATSLMDEEVGTLGVPDPRILIVGCGGSGNNTLNRITHLGVEGAVWSPSTPTSSTSTTPERFRNSSSAATSPEAWVRAATRPPADAVLKPVER